MSETTETKSSAKEFGVEVGKGVVISAATSAAGVAATFAVFAAVGIAMDWNEKRKAKKNQK